jgi:hypothetical protein
MEALQPGQVRWVALQPLWRTHERLRTSRLPGQAAAVTGFPKKVRDLIFTRAQDFCEICGFDRPEQAHHRRARGAGGSRRPDTNQASNGLAISGACHQMVESRRTLAYERGWLVRQGHNPTQVPVLRYGSEWVLLDNTGNTTPCNETDRGKP